ncbi:MAG: MoxR family ATPase [Gammaproteobacteria bacterium]|nr:MoxR family ATPase [Gammaproteobacteria bacterium]MXX16145.1 MoxR family ATPase [Gammaproteobacteria bacterium]MYG66918.1 MoxR family ATPase [Gammaproteobacteria bacterium]
MPDPETLMDRFAAAGYIAETELATVLVLMHRLGRPLLVEGEAGVGKTEIARTLATVEDRRLIRLQCYEGLDTNAAVYEWNYSRQLLSIQLQEAGAAQESLDIFAPEFLLERPLLQSIRQPEPPVLLIDEIDRADEAFEAYLLELLSDFQVTIPELGTLSARSLPTVILTSNGSRDLSDALRRRCLYHYLDYPDHARELAIVEARLPGISHRLADQVTRVVQILRGRNLAKSPGIAEMLDWCSALMAASVDSLPADGELLAATRGCVLKNREDFDAVGADELADIVRQIA